MPSARTRASSEEEICGARVVDKCSGGRCMYRLELWFRKKDNQPLADELLCKPVAVSVERVVGEG